MNIFSKLFGGKRNSQPATFDIWKFWNRKASVVFIKKDTPLLFENFIVVYAWSQPQFVQEDACALLTKHGIGIECKFQHTAIIEALYFAIVRNHYGIRILCEDFGETVISAEKLSEDKNLIEWLSNIFGYSFYGIKAQEFVNESRDMKLYHSTPLGDHESGKPKLYLLENSKDKADNTRYVPVFLTQEHMMEFYKDAGRPNYLILTSALKDVLKTLDSNDLLSQLGLVIEPKYCGVSIPAGIRASKQ